MMQVSVSCCWWGRVAWLSGPWGLLASTGLRRGSESTSMWHVSEMKESPSHTNTWSESLTSCHNLSQQLPKQCSPHGNNTCSHALPSGCLMKLLLFFFLQGRRMESQILFFITTLQVIGNFPKIKDVHTYTILSKQLRGKWWSCCQNCNFWQTCWNTTHQDNW